MTNLYWGKIRVLSSSLYAPDLRGKTGERRTPRLLSAAALSYLLWSPVLCAQDTSTTHRVLFDIPQQPAESALLEFAEQADISLVVRFDEVSGRAANRLSGEYTLDEGIALLLAGTGLKPTFRSELVLSIETTADVGPEEEGMSDAGGSNSGVKKAGFFAALASVLAGPGTSAQEADEGIEEQLEEVIVVGSQIRGASTTEALPVSVVTQEDIQAIGAASSDELFRTIPGVGAVGFGGNNQRSVSFGINGARGDVASINLRSLGEGNTLVLLNGRRLVDHPGTQTNEQTAPAVTVNMNAIPIMGLQRVEVLRDGASAIYGTDAVAGVVNTVLRKDYEGLEISARYGAADENPEETSISILGGLTFNGDQTNISGSYAYHDRSTLYARDRSYSRSADLRPLFAGTAFEGDIQLRNTSGIAPWGGFRAIAADGSGAILQNGVPITTSAGGYHVRPASLGDCTAANPAGPADTCLALSQFIPGDLRFDSNQRRSMIPSVTRHNFFGNVTHTFDNDYELYAEVGLYKAESEFDRADGIFGPLTSQPFDVPASNYWNPFGPVTFSDGSPNPNRLPGLDLNQVPAEGLGFTWSFGGGPNRVLDRPGAIVNVDDESYRALLGLRGNIGDWDFDTAFVTSAAETLDRTDNRFSLTEAFALAGLENPGAINFWNGGGEYTDNAIDTSLNGAGNLDSAYVSVDRFARTRLTLVDFKLSNASLFELPAGNLGFAGGVEFRRQTYEDDRDPRLDGTRTFFNPIRNSNVPSDVAGSSDTPDTFGKREVFSVFAEVALPLVAPDMGVPLVESLDLQLAARFEDYDDIGNITKPRFALSWYPAEWLQFRGSYSEGFRAPNLPQTSEPEISRVVGRPDLYYCQAQVNRGLVPNLAACDDTGIGNEFGGSMERITSGSEELKPEESESTSFGLVLQPPFAEGLTVTVDYWEIEQSGIIGIFATPNQLALDWALRTSGQGSNPNIIRDEPTADNIAFFAGSGLEPVGAAVRSLVPYFNLEDRVTEGVDFSVLYDLDTANLGAFSFGINATQLTKAFQSATGPSEIINAQNNPAVQVEAAGDLIEQDQRPEWKGNAFVRWSGQSFGASAFVNYVGKFVDTSVRNDITAAPLPVDSWTTVNVTGEYRFSAGMFDDATVRVGINNLFDEDPPLADENFGYLASLHSPYGQYAYINVVLGMGR